MPGPGFAQAEAGEQEQRPLRVGVLVDLPLDRHAGGHAKFWRRIGDAALAHAGSLDLTLHFNGEAPERRTIAENLRYILEPACFSTRRLSFLAYVPDDTDLAPWHPRLAHMIRDYDVVHTTDAYFAYARTARRVARRRGIALVNSVHTNTPPLARLYTRETIERLLGHGLAGRLLAERLPGRVEARMIRRLEEHNRASDFVFVSRPDQLAAAEAATGGRAALLRRGIDRELFHPAKRDRQRMAHDFGIPPERLVVLFVGRVDRGKNILLLAAGLKPLLDRGVDLHLLCCGEGDRRADIEAALPGRASCPGGIEPERLAAIYASADLFALPSRVEEYANVVLEALASGLPVMVSARSSMGRLLIENVTGLVLPGGDAGAWAEAIAALIADPARRRDMSHAARAYAERRLPSWDDVLATDLLPHWREVTERRRHTT
jgi:glycosyltransferase involved in cell wall biosynthesis